MNRIGKWITLLAIAAIVIAGIFIVINIDRKSIPSSADSPMQIMDSTPAATEMADLSTRILETEDSPPSTRPSQTTTAIADTTGHDAPSTPTAGESSGEASPRVTVRGRVTLSEGGPAAAGARVRLLNEIYTSARIYETVIAAEGAAGPDGEYELTGPRHWRLKVEASLPGRARIAKRVFSQSEIRDREAMERIREAEVNIELPPAAVVAGVVEDEEGRPIAGARVAAGVRFAVGEGFMPLEQTAVTGADGAFRFDALPPEIVTLGARAEGYLPASAEITAPDEAVTLRLVRGGATIRGTVFRHPEGTPLEGVDISLIPSSGAIVAIPGFTTSKTTSGALGEFAFTGLPAGAYLLHAESGDERLGMWPERRLTRDGVYVGENEDKPGVEIIMYAGHTIRGTVTESESGEPLEGVIVKTDRTRAAPSESDAEGHFVLTGVREEYVMLEADKPGYMIDETRGMLGGVTVRLTLDSLDAAADIAMRRAVEISGFVRAPDGEPVEDAEAFLSDHRLRINTTRTGADGGFTLAAMPFAAQRVCVRAAGWPVTLSDVIQISDTSVRDVVITLRPGATVTGEVVDIQDAPVAGAGVSASITISVPGVLMQYSESCGTAQTDAEGRFELSNLPQGEVSISAGKTGYRRSERKSLDLKPGERVEGVRLQLLDNHYIAGRILNEEGEPVRPLSIMFGQSRGEMRHGGRFSPDGHYRIEGLADMPVTITVFHREYAQTSATSPTVDRDDFDIVLKSKKTVELIGRVIDHATRAPVTEFKVEGRSLPIVVYDDVEPGVFRIPDLQTNYITEVIIRAADYAPSPNVVRLPEDEPRLELTFEVGPGGAVTGRLLGAGGEPAADVPITAEDITRRQIIIEGLAATAKSAEDGRFRIERLEPGNYRITFRPAAPLVQIARDVEIKQHGDVFDFGDVALWGGGRIHGRLVRVPGGAPVAGARIEILKMFTVREAIQMSAVTDEAGAFEFTGVPEGRFEVTAPEWGARAEADIALEVAESAEVALRAGTASLTVRATMGGGPVERANVALTTAEGAAGPKGQTNSEGVIAFANLAPGAWTAQVDTRTDFQWLVIEFDVEVEEGEALERAVDFPAGMIIGRVVDAAGEPVDNAQVKAELTSEPPVRDYTYRPSAGSQSWTRVSGQFSIDYIDPGIYTVRAEKDDAAAEVTGVVVPESGTMPEVELRLGGAD